MEVCQNVPRLICCVDHAKNATDNYVHVVINHNHAVALLPTSIWVLQDAADVNAGAL